MTRRGEIMTAGRGILFKVPEELFGDPAFDALGEIARAVDGQVYPAGSIFWAIPPKLRDELKKKGKRR